MGKDFFRLYWKDQCLGTISEIEWADFPWAQGRFHAGDMSGEVREVLDYITTQSATEDGLIDWPFAEELGEQWKIVAPDGMTKEIAPPIIDFEEGSITWR
ncbi:MAG TPA: hypothetical protein VGH19_22930 [Verrucomicrobiae bacterium]